VDVEVLAEGSAGVRFGRGGNEKGPDPVAVVAPHRRIGVVGAVIVFLVNGAVGQPPRFVAHVPDFGDGLEKGVLGLTAGALVDPGPVENIHVEAIHRARLAGVHAGRAPDDDVGMHAALAFQHHEMVLEMQRAGVDDREMRQLGRIFDHTDGIRHEVPATGAGIEVEGAMRIDVARLDPVQVVREFPAVFEHRRRAEIAVGIRAESEREQAVREDERLDVRRLQIAGLRGRAVDRELVPGCSPGGEPVRPGTCYHGVRFRDDKTDKILADGNLLGTGWNAEHQCSDERHKHRRQGSAKANGLHSVSIASVCGGSIHNS